MNPSRFKVTGHRSATIITGILLISCRFTWIQSSELGVFNNYFKAESDERWNFTADTVRLWFDERSGEPILRIKGQASNGKWKAWDEEMRTIIEIDSIWYDDNAHAVSGYFYENNDFYELIGKPPTKTLRTYWFEEMKIRDILIYWIPEVNTTSDVFLEPIVSWAEIYANDEILELYPNNKIVPSKENAIKWRNLINRYYSDKKK